MIQVTVEEGVKRRPHPDPQQDLVYAAETAAGCHESRRFDDLQASAEFVRACLASGLIEQDYPRVRTFVYKGNDPGHILIKEYRPRKSKDPDGSQTIAKASATTIWLSPPAFCTGMILHELAHLVTARHFTGPLARGHGWAYCSVYLKLVGWFIGYKEQEALQEEFEKRGVQYKQPPLPQWMLSRVN